MNGLLVVLGLYAAAGTAFGLAFALRGAGRIDPVARSAPLRVRLLFVPGAAALWPALMMRWRHAARTRARGEDA